MSQSANLRYFDYAATAPVDSRVMEAMFGRLGIDGDFGNPASSSYSAGRRAQQLVEHARERVAMLIRADVEDIVWTSGATGSNNLALKGYAERAVGKTHLVTSLLEHKAVLDTVGSLQKQGMSVIYLDPLPDGEIRVDAVAAAVGQNTGLVSLMLVNNELGTLTAIGVVSRVVHAAGALLHGDAAQTLGKTPIDVKLPGIDLTSMSAHKVYGPKGIGGLYVSREEFERIAPPQMHGGGHERGLRSGTLAAHQIVGMGVACELALSAMNDGNERSSRLGERLLGGVLSLTGVRQNAAGARRIPHTLSLTFELPEFFTSMLTGDRHGDLFNFGLQLVCWCSFPCADRFGLDEYAASRTVRLSLGRFTTQDDIDFAIACIRRVLDQRRPAAVTI